MRIQVNPGLPKPHGTRSLTKRRTPAQFPFVYLRVLLWLHALGRKPAPNLVPETVPAGGKQPVRSCMVSGMDKKQINSPKLTANFLLWIGLFLLAMFLLIAHFVWRLF